MDTRIFSDPAVLAEALATLFVDCARAAMTERGDFCVALAGGTTPKAAYGLLAKAPFDTALDWNRVQVFFGDERCVGPADDQSNYKMANDAFMRSVGIPPGNIQRMRGEDAPAEAAAAYRDKLVAQLGAHPRLDLAILGMGPDGHTASLFPGTDPFTDERRLVRAVYSQSQAQWRITLTPAVFNAARTVVFAVEGAGKAQTVARVLEGPNNPTDLPAQSIAPRDGNLIWLLDREAAADRVATHGRNGAGT
jgi:6-phosphogluconolactonase